MSEKQHGFDEALISGYLDGELTQGEEQRVRLEHLDQQKIHAIEPRQK